MRPLLTRSALALFITGSLAASGASFAQEQNPPEEGTQLQLPPSQQAQGQQLAARAGCGGDEIPRGEFHLSQHEQRAGVRRVAQPRRHDPARGRRAGRCASDGERVRCIRRELRGPRRSDPKVSGTFQPGTAGDFSDDPMKRPIDRQMERRDTMTHADQYDRYKTQYHPGAHHADGARRHHAGNPR